MPLLGYDGRGFVLCSRYAGPYVTPEQEGLERALTDAVREVSTAARLADMAGLDAAQIDRTGSVADVWHSIIGMAIQDGVLGELVERAQAEHPRNSAIKTAWQTYQAATLPARVPVKRPPRGQAGANLSDQYRDARIDQMQRDLATQGAQIAGLVVQVSNLAKEVAALTDMVRAQSNEHDAPPLSNTQFAAIMTASAVIAILVFAAVYWGGNR